MVIVFRVLFGEVGGEGAQLGLMAWLNGLEFN